MRPETLEDRLLKRVGRKRGDVFQHIEQIMNSIKSVIKNKAWDGGTLVGPERSAWRRTDNWRAARGRRRIGRPDYRLERPGTLHRAEVSCVHGTR